MNKSDKVDIVSNYDGKTCTSKYFLIVTYNIPKGNLAPYYPETNVLIPIDAYMDKRWTPVSKSVRLMLVK
jgi:hypothetical protein